MAKQSKHGLAVTLFLFVMLIARAAGAGTLVPGVTAPDFTLQRPSGERITLSRLKGKVVVVNFWNSG